MKIAIFGSTGHIGRELVAQGLGAGHEVTAFARDAAKVGASAPNLRVAVGNVLDPAAVETAVVGTGAVLCALGAPLMDKSGLRAKGTANIVAAMERTGVRRLVVLSALGTGDSRAILPASYRHLILPLVLGRVVADHGRQEELVSASRLDWVIVRAGNFVAGGRTGRYRHGCFRPDRSLKFKISHGDVADFMLRQLADDTYLRQAPGISY